MFDPMKLPHDFREQLYNLPRGTLRPLRVEEVDEGPATPPNTPEPPDPEPLESKTPGREGREGKEGLPSASPSWILRMRIPSLTSEMSEAETAEHVRRYSTITHEEVPVEDHEHHDRSSSSSATADADCSFAMGFPEPLVEGFEGEILRRERIRVHWLDLQELKVDQQLRRGQVCWSEEWIPRQAGGSVGRPRRILSGQGTALFGEVSMPIQSWLKTQR